MTLYAPQAPSGGSTRLLTSNTYISGETNISLLSGISGLRSWVISVTASPRRPTCVPLLGFFERSQLLKPEGEYWRRLEPGARHKTYEWLDEALNKAIARQAEEQNAAARRRHLQQMHTPPPGAQQHAQQHNNKHHKKWANTAGAADAQGHINAAASGGSVPGRPLGTLPGRTGKAPAGANNGTPPWEGQAEQGTRTWRHGLWGG